MNKLIVFDLDGTLAETKASIDDGKWITPPTRELVPGDVIRMRLGDVVPADARFHLDHRHLQPMMYLMLSVAGHLTIFQTRTRGPFWSIRPAPILWIAVLGKQALATLIAVYKLFMPPLGWGWALLVWGYALAWFLITDPIKLLAYRIFDPAKPKIDPPKPRLDPVKPGA